MDILGIPKDEEERPHLEGHEITAREFVHTRMALAKTADDIVSVVDALFNHSPATKADAGSEDDFF